MLYMGVEVPVSISVPCNSRGPGREAERHPFGLNGTLCFYRNNVITASAFRPKTMQRSHFPSPLLLVGLRNPSALPQCHPPGWRLWSYRGAKKQYRVGVEPAPLPHEHEGALFRFRNGPGSTITGHLSFSLSPRTTWTWLHPPLRTHCSMMMGSQKRRHPWWTVTMLPSRAPSLPHGLKTNSMVEFHMHLLDSSNAVPSAPSQLCNAF